MGSRKSNSGSFKKGHIPATKGKPLSVVHRKKLSEKETIIKSLENTKEFAEKIVIRYNRVNHSIFLSNILYIESLSDYIKVVTLDDEIVTKERISTNIIKKTPYITILPTLIQIESINFT